MQAAFFDVDGTLTTDRVWSGLIAYFRRHRLRRWTNIAFWAYHIPYYFIRRAGLISEAAFRRPWAAHLAWYFRGYPIEQAEPIWRWVVEDHLAHIWRRDTRQLLEGHLREGDLVVLVSGSPVPLLTRIGRELGVQHVVGTDLEVRQGRYTGRSMRPVCIDENKPDLVKRYLLNQEFTIDFAASHVYADSTSDLPLLEMVGHPVATYPDAELENIARTRGWQIFP
jgi:HAD superfamily hydrolase (TIGR01490 family)